MKSVRPIKPLSEIILPFRITFPVTIEGSINGDNYVFPRNKEVVLNYAQYELLTNSSYAKYLT